MASGTNWRLHLSCISCYFNLICQGMTVNYSSPAFPDINSGNYGFKLSNVMMSWLASFNVLFAIPGGIFVVPLMDRYGRKFAIILSTLPLALGWLFIICSNNIITFAIGRILTGLTYGMAYGCISIYISEISPKTVRGVNNACVNIFYNLGGLLVNLLGAFINWQWLAFAGLTFAFIACLTSLFMNETPRWLVSKGHREVAANILKVLGKSKDDAQIENEIKEMASVLKLVNSWSLKEGLQQILKPPLFRPLIIMQLLTILCQFTGFTFISTFTVTIFQETTSDWQSDSAVFQNANYQSSLTAASQLVGSLMSLCLVDRMGRRFMLIISGTTMTLSLAAFGAYFYLQIYNVDVDDDYLYWLPLTCLMVCTLGTGLAYGYVPALLMSEMFPLQVKGIINGVGSFTKNFCKFLVVQVPASMIYTPNYIIYWIFTGFSLLSVIFVVLFVPETKDRSLEEIQQQWYSSKPSKSLTKLCCGNKETI